MLGTLGVGAAGRLVGVYGISLWKFIRYVWASSVVICCEVGMDLKFSFGIIGGVERWPWRSEHQSCHFHSASISFDQGSLLGMLEYKISNKESTDINSLSLKALIIGGVERRPYYVTMRGSLDVYFPWKSIWCSEASRRFFFFLLFGMEGSLGKVLTCKSL